MIHCHLTKEGEKKLRNEAFPGPGGMGGRGVCGGVVPTPLWIALQMTHPVSFFPTKILHIDY